MTPYEWGWDCAMRGPNITNCHFSIFSTRENTAEWERGKRDGDAHKSKTSAKRARAGRKAAAIERAKPAQDKAVARR